MGMAQTIDGRPARAVDVILAAGIEEPSALAIGNLRKIGAGHFTFAQPGKAARRAIHWPSFETCEAGGIASGAPSLRQICLKGRVLSSYATKQSILEGTPTDAAAGRSALPRNPGRPCGRARGCPWRRARNLVPP